MADNCPGSIPSAGPLPQYVTSHPAFHPSGVGKWGPASTRKEKAGMVHFVSGWTRGVQVKLWDPLRTLAIPECFEVCLRQGAIQIHVYIYWVELVGNSVTPTADTLLLTVCLCPLDSQMSSSNILVLEERASNMWMFIVNDIFSPTSQSQWPWYLVTLMSVVNIICHMQTSLLYLAALCLTSNSMTARFYSQDYNSASLYSAAVLQADYPHYCVVEAEHIQERAECSVHSSAVLQADYHCYCVVHAVHRYCCSKWWVCASLC